MEHVIGSEEKLLENAYVQFETKLNDTIIGIKQDATLSSKEKETNIREKLEAIRDRILGLRIIMVEVDNEDDAYTIFETLNTRGKDLTVGDLLKNLLLKSDRMQDWILLRKSGINYVKHWITRVK